MCIVFYHPTSLKCDIKGECYVEEVRKCKIDFSEKLSMEWRAAGAFQKGGGENRAGGILFEKGPHDQVILHQSFPVLLGCILYFPGDFLTVELRVSQSKFFLYKVSTYFPSERKKKAM